MRNIIFIDSDKCTGCRICEVACSYFKTGKFNPRKSRIRVTRLPRIGFDKPYVCIQCPNAKCVTACPVEALEKQSPLGTIKLLDNKCTGCAACVDACPMGAVNIDPETGLPLICDLCDGEPKCVEYCPKDALTYDKGHTVSNRRRLDRTKKDSKTHIKRWGLPPAS